MNKHTTDNYIEFFAQLTVWHFLQKPQWPLQQKPNPTASTPVFLQTLQDMRSAEFKNNNNKWIHRHQTRNKQITIEYVRWSEQFIERHCGHLSGSTEEFRSQSLALYFIVETASLPLLQCTMLFRQVLRKVVISKHITFLFRLFFFCTPPVSITASSSCNIQTIQSVTFTYATWDHEVVRMCLYLSLLLLL